MENTKSLIFSLFLFFLDVNFYLGIGAPLFFFLLCWYCVQCLFFEKPLYIAPLLFLSLESFLYFGIFGLELIWLVPLTILFVCFSHHFSFTFSKPFCMLFLALLGKLVLGRILFGFGTSGLFTASLICANMIITLLFSLKYKSKLGNRFSLG